MKRSELEEIIQEEIYNYLEEKRAAVGKNKQGKFTSAGTVPPQKDRKMSGSEISAREKLGKKLLNLWRRGGEKGNRFRESVKKYADDHGLSIEGDRKTAYSIIWAIASGRAMKRKK